MVVNVELAGPANTIIEANNLTVRGHFPPNAPVFGIKPGSFKLSFGIKMYAELFQSSKMNVQCV